jgi:hypothetical protein
MSAAMNPGIRSIWLLGFGLALLAGGCNRALNFEKTLAMGPGDVKSFSVDAPRGEQKVTVTFTSSEAPVDVYVALEKDLESAASAIQNFKTPNSVLANQLKARTGSIEAVIPAKEAFGVIVANAIKDSSVQVKIAGK